MCVSECYMQMMTIVAVVVAFAVVVALTQSHLVQCTRFYLLIVQ